MVKGNFIKVEESDFKDLDAFVDALLESIGLVEEPPPEKAGEKETVPPSTENSGQT